MKKILLVVTVAVAPLLAYAFVSSAPETSSYGGSCRPYRGNPNYAAYCAPLEQMACEAEVYVCVWVK